jgi:hypothetical protein
MKTHDIGLHVFRHRLIVEICSVVISLSASHSEAPNLISVVTILIILLLYINSVAFSPQANYTDWSTASRWRILVQTFADRGMSRGQRGGNHAAVSLSFLHRSRYFFFQVAPHLSSWGWVGPVPEPLVIRKFGSAGNRTRDLRFCSQELWPLYHNIYIYTYVCVCICGLVIIMTGEIERVGVN